MTTMAKIATLCAIAALPVLTSRVAAAAESYDWPCYRGPQRNGISAEVLWSPTKLTAQPTVLWKAEVGIGHSGIATKDGKVVTLGAKENKVTVYCLDAATGKEVWTYTFEYKPCDWPGPRATPTIDDGQVYVVSSDGQVYCLDMKTGKPIWNKNVVSDLKGGVPTWGIATSPYINGKTVILNVLSHGVVLNKADGSVVWQSPADTCGYATPVVYKRGNEQGLAMFGKDAIRGVDLKTGKQLWSHGWKTAWDVNAADPIPVENNLFVASGYECRSVMLDVSGAEPKVIWENKNLGTQFSTAVLIGGNLYGIHGNTGSGKLICLNPKDGTKKWEQGGQFEALMAAGDRLITLNGKGELIIAEATPAAYKQLARAEVLPTKGAKMWTAPVLSNGRIYCRNSLGNLVCLDVSK